MNYYETLYIIHPALEAGRLKDLIISIEENLKKMGGNPLAVELWGKRKLAYFIDKQKYGTYVLIQYNGEGKCTNKFSVELEHNPNILAYLTTNINQNDVIEQKEDLETQIVGKTREAERSRSHIEKDKGGKSTISDDKKPEDNPSEVTNEEETAGGGDKNVDVTEELKQTDENKSTEENPSKETVSESRQKKADEPTTISEEE